MNAGIYEIVNIDNGKRYIGSAYNLLKRRSDHFNMLRAGRHHSLYLQRAFNRYKEGSFVFKIILYCPKEDTKGRLMLEQTYIDTVSPEYNINPNALSSQGVKRRPETCKKIGDSKRGDKNARYWEGKPRKTSVKNKISRTLKDYYKANPHPLKGKSGIHSEKGRESMRERNKHYKNRKGKFLYSDIIQMDLNGNELAYHESAVDAQKSLGLKKSASSKIIRACKDPEAKSAYGFKWKFKFPEKYL